MSGTHPRVWLRNQEARELQARCDNAVQDLAKRLDAAVRYMPAAGSHPSDSLEVHATKWARATRLQLEASWEITFEDKLQPHERKRLSELRRNLAKSEVVACAYDHILRRRPCYNTFTPDLRHVEPNSALACQLEMDDFHGLHRAGREAGGWPSSITAKQYMPPPQKQQRRQQQQQPRAQCKSKMSDEAQVDCLGSCVASLAFELISLVLQDMASVFFPPESTLNRSNPADQDRLDPHPSEAQSSDTNSRRSRLSKQAGQQQQTKREELQQQAEDELLEKSDRAQNCHAMHWRDLVAILFYLPDCMKMDARSPQTLWRIAESAHVATCMCQLLGLVFAFAKNNEPWARKVLACPSAEELARVLTMQVSSMATHSSKNNAVGMLLAVEQCWDFALACCQEAWWQEALLVEKEQASNPQNSGSTTKRKGRDAAGSSSVSMEMKAIDNDCKAPVLFWGRAVHACAWAAHVLLSRCLRDWVTFMDSNERSTLSMLRLVAQTLQELQWEGEREQAGHVGPSRSRPSSSVAAASAGALVIETLAGKPWTWHCHTPDKDRLKQLEQVLRHANTLAACTRLQLNFTVAEFSSMTSARGNGSGKKIVEEGHAAAAAAPTTAAEGVYSSNFSPQQAQAAFMDGFTHTSQAHYASEADVHALRADVALVFTAACRLVRALHLLFSKPHGCTHGQPFTSKTHLPAETETCSALRLLLRQNAKMLAETICLQLPNLTSVVGLTGLAVAELLQQLLQMALYLKACYENREELVPRVSRQKFGMLIERLTSVDLCRPLLVQDNPRPTIARFLFQRPYLSAHLCDVLCNKACTDMQAAVESMEQYNVLSSLSVLPKLRLLQQLLPSLTCPISTGNAHSWNSLMALTQPSNRPCQANGRMQNLVQLALHMEYLGHAGAAWLMSCFFVPLVRIACFIEAAPLASLYAEIRNPSAFLNSSILHTAMSYASSSQATSSSNDSGFDTSDGGAAKRVSTGHPHPSQKQDAAQVGNEQRQQPQGSSPGFDTSEVAAKKVSTGQRHPGQEQEAERQLQQQQRQGPEQQQQQQQQQQGEKQQPGEKQQQHKTELQGVQQKHRDEMQQKLQKLQQVGQLQGPAKQQKAEQLPQPPPPPQHQQQQQQVGQTEQQQQQEGQAEQQQQQQRQAGEEGQCPLMQALQLMQQDGLTQQFEHFCCRQELTALKLLSTLASQANFQRQFDLQKNVCSLHQQLQYMELFEHCLTTQSVAQKSSKMASASAGTVIKEFLLSCAHYQQQLHEGLTVCKSDSFRRQRVIAQLQKLQATRWKELVQLYQDRAGSEQQSVQPTSQQQQQQQQQQVQQPRTHHQQQQQQQHVCPSLATGTAMQRTLFAPCPLTQGMGKQLTLLLQQPGAFQAIGVAATFCPRELAAVDSYFIHKGFGSLCDGLPEEQAKRVRESKAELQEEVGRRLGSAYKQAQQQQDQGEWADREHTPAADSVWVGHQGVEECEHWGQPPECTAPAASCEEDSRSTAAAAAAGWEIGFSAALAGLDEEDFLQRLQQHLDGGVSGSDAVAGSNFSAGPEQNEGGVSHGRGQDQERDRHGLQGLQQQLLQQGRIWDQQGQQIQQQAQQQQQQQQQQGHERLQMVGQRCTEVKEAQAMKEAAEKLQSLEKRRKQALRLLNRPPKEAQRQLGPESDLDIEREGDIERELRQDVDKLKREVEQLKKEGTKQKGQQIQQQQQQQQLQQQQQQQQGHEQLRIEEQRCKGVMRDQAIQETAEGVECIERKLQQALPPWASEQAQRQLAKRNSDLVIKREMLKQALEQLKKHGSTRRASKSAESQHPEPSAPPSDAFSAASPACGGLNNEGGGAAGSATLHTNSVTCGAPAVVGSDGVQADSTSRGAAAAVGGYESGADGLRPLSCTEAAQLACQQQGWEVLQLGITRDRASTDESPSLGHDLPTTTSYPDCCASTAEGQSSPPWQPQRLIDQFLDPDAQQRRMYTQLCHGSRVCNAFVEHHKQALADAGLSAPLMLPIPPIPPRASPQAPAWTQLLPPNPYEHELKSCQKHKAQGGVNCEALVCKIAHELNKEQLYTLVSSPFSQRLALWHDSLTKLHCATNNLEINAAEELQQRAAAAEEDEELRGTLRIWALDSGFESPWHSQLVACSNISCANLTRQRSGQLRSAEGVVCPACSTAVFCSHTCLLVAMTGAQAHCMHYMQKRESAGEAEAECRTERGQAKR